MGHKALIEDLRQKSSERIGRIWREVEERAEKLRASKQEEFKRSRDEMEGQLKSTALKIAVPILYEAERTALRIEDEALQRLAARLARLATTVLDEVRQHDYDSFFKQLVREMPDIAWERIQVNPQDIELAGSLFPGVKLEGDPSILGGFVASGDNGQFKVMNTIEKRLENGWPMILPFLINEIRKEHDAELAA